MRLIRANAPAWNVDPGRLGIMGFSAGGHLASTVSTHFDLGDASAADTTGRQSARPDFAILCYPVITFEPPYAHMGSRNNLLGDTQPEELVKNLSNHTQVTDQTPPTFLFHTADDPGVPVQNSLLYFGALREHNVPAELHVYEHGRRRGPGPRYARTRNARPLQRLAARTRHLEEIAVPPAAPTRQDLEKPQRPHDGSLKSD